jgi:glycosyltransferase involved in cell wall biosynthesis
MKLHRVYILAKNEIRNIGRALEQLAAAGAGVTVLDSGSTDGTIELARRHGAEVEPFHYVDHCASYNRITAATPADRFVMIIDADVVVPRALIAEVEARLSADGPPDVLVAPVLMYWEGLPLRHSSLYPPKPFVFRGGLEHFEPVGHGERLRPAVRWATTSGSIVHDDRKELGQVMQNQVRYARALLHRALRGQLSSRDRLRARTPLFLFLTPLYAYLFKLGFLDGRAGLIYAVDRLIAEALAFRTAISPLCRAEEERTAAEARRA